MKKSISSRAFTLIIASVLFTSCIGLVLSTDGDQATFIAPELLGCVTDNSVIVNVVAQEPIEAYFEYGTQSGVYTDSTGQYSADGGNPLEVVIDGLEKSTHYYYRMVYRIQGDQQWIHRAEHSFQTQRSKGETFTFTVISDSHVSSMGGMGSTSSYEQALQNVLDNNPDFHLDLGDTFMIDGVTSDVAVQTQYLFQRSCMSIISGSVPIFLTPGNHENEEGWNIDDSPYSIAIGSIKARKMYYPTPTEGEFYTGNSDPLSLVGGDNLREDYYAWTWGDALFVFVDPYQYTMALPYNGGMAGEGTDDPTTGDQWSWTLGQEQYNWFKNTLEGSDAKYKFVFSHHVTGGQLASSGMAGGVGYVRGGANAAPYFEWGGRNADGTWGFDTMRPGWGNKSIHQLMVENGVSAYFHGHDHQYAYEKIDGIVYQAMPSPAMTGSGFNLYSESDPNTIKVLPNSGHLKVTVTPTEVSIDYVRSGSSNGQISYTYTIEPSSVNETPVANDQSVSTGVNTHVGVTLTASDPEGDTLYYQIVTQPVHGALSGTGNSGTYTPDSGYTGSDSFTFKVTDGWTESNIATVSITVG